MLDRLKTDKAIQDETDNLGGGGVIASGAYDFIIELAYFGVSAGGAISFTVVFKDSSGASLTQIFWVTSGTAKGGNNYYTDKGGKKQYLPGFSLANSMCKLAIQKEIGDLASEKKVISKYNFDLNKMAPTEVDMVMTLLGQPITVGVLKQIVDKTAKDSTGAYTPTGETKEENDVNKFFRASDKLTGTEIKAGSTTHEFYDRWVEKHKDVTKDKSTVKSSGSPLSKSPTAQPAADSLFGNTETSNSMEADVNKAEENIFDQ